jgi:hypothetical protein
VFKLRVSERMHVVDFLSFHHVKVNSLVGGTWGDNFPFSFVLIMWTGTTKLLKWSISRRSTGRVGVGRARWGVKLVQKPGV